MRDFTIETFLLIGGTLVSGLIGLGVIGGGVPALVCAGIGFGIATWLLTRRLP